MDFEKVIQDIKIICMNKTYNNFHMKVEYILVRNSLSVSLKIIVRSGKYKHDRDETKIRVCILLSSNRYLKLATCYRQVKNLWVKIATRKPFI